MNTIEMTCAMPIQMYNSGPNIPTTNKNSKKNDTTRNNNPKVKSFAFLTILFKA